MTYRDRYRLIYTLLLTALLAGGSITAMAQGSGTSTGVVVRGNVYGGGNQAAVKINSEVNISTGQVEGNVYGGGNLGDVGTHVDQATPSVGNYDWKDQDGAIIGDNTAANKMTGFSQVNITGGTIGLVGENATSDEDHGNVFGGGKGAATTFECEQGMVYRTNVSISTTGSVVKGNVYGGGEVSRVEENTVVTIGTASGSDVPIIEGSVFAAGAGIETHGYSALVRGTSTVTVQGSTQVWKNVYGGGQLASVGRYKVKTPANEEDDDVPATLPYGMPAHLVNGGTSTVVIQNSAVIGTDNVATTGHVYGAGQGIEPRQDYDYQTQAQYNAIEGNNPDNYNIDEHQPKRMNKVNGVDTWQYFETKAAYLQFVETLALSAGTNVTITGGATIKGSVFGGSESGFVYHDTDVKIQGGTINGDAFGGGRGLESFAEAGRVRGNTELTISSGAAVHGNVYGGGNLGDVGTINKSDANYNYVWKNSDANGNNLATADFNNIAGYNVPSSSTHDTNKNTGICTVTINGGTIGTGVQMSDDGTFANGNVFGAGRGSTKTWWCEKAIAYATSVTINAGIVNGSVYGGGEVGRVEDDAKVVIGVANATGNATPTITGSVFGAGAGKKTHGYSALVRGNAAVTVQGVAQVGESVYGGGEIASVGKFNVVGGLPTTPLTGGYCTVEVKGNAKVGASGTGHNVFGACKGVTPAYNNTQNNPNRSKSMQLVAYKPDGAAGTTWDEYEDEDGNRDARFIWRYYASKDDYLAFLKTLALTSHPTVTIGGSASVYGSVYGGGQRGVTLGNVDVNITSGTIEQDVYGGGALADTNLGNWDVNGYVVATGLTAGTSSVTGLYTKEVVEGKDTYTKITDESATAADGITYYRQEATWAHTEGSAYYKTTVDLTGGTIKGDAYGGGLGQKIGFNSATSSIEATVWGDIAVNLGSSGSSSATSFWTTYDTDNNGNSVVKSGRVFGCNNLLGSPQGNVTVTVWTTVDGYNANGEPITKTLEANKNSTTETDHTYRLAAVYGGGNLAPFTATGKKAYVIIHGCSDTSILTVYGGGNAAAVPGTDVDVYSAYEIGALFGGGNGKDKYKNDAGWQINPGANVNGNTDTMIYGGTVHEAYGASNEKGTIYGNVAIDASGTNPENCTLDVAKLVGAGKNADVFGDLILVMGCKPETKIPLVYGGADNANVNGNVELTITSGNFEKVVGGNNDGGAIKGHIILNIEETTCIPINIDHLYLCGYNAAYSQYGYYVKTTKTEGTPIGDTDETAVLEDGKLQLIPRESIDDPHLPVDTYSYTVNETTGEVEATWTVLPITGNNKFGGYAPPVLNVISCTSIGEVFGGGFGTGATVYGNPTVNINMIPGAYATDIQRSGSSNAHDLGAIGAVYGGGDAAAVHGNTKVNIGTATTVPVFVFDDASGEYELQYDGDTPRTQTKNVEGAYITGNVYGGGKLADVTGNTFVNVCAEQVAVVNSNNEPTGDFTYNIVNYTGTGYQGVTIGGNVYGGGEGYAKMEEGTAGEAFLCAKAMIGVDGEGIEDKDHDGKADHPEGGTSVVIANGTVGTTLPNGTLKPNTGNVYGGGQVGRVEKNTKVTIGIGNGTGTSSATSTPVILGNVFGAGAGVNTHGYSALVRGTSTVLVEGDAKVLGSVYGGGEKASVGRYRVDDDGLPVTLNNALAPTSGYCYVTIRGFAEIGPDDMEMTKSGGPDDTGYVFGACKGVLPYQDAANEPIHMDGIRQSDGSWKDNKKTYPAYNAAADLNGNYAKFIKSLALATQTLVTIEGNPFIKGGVYGGSENGFVQKNTHVVISGGQVGNGFVQVDDEGNSLSTKRSVNRRYTAAEWAAGRLFAENDPDYTTGTDTELESLVSPNASTHYYTSSLPECASWPFGADTDGDGENDLFAPYDKDADANGNYTSGSAYADAKGGRATGSDGHTFYGNVFGGGSGYFPYKPGRWFEDAGAVYGNAQVDITGGHILTNIYGGNEMTNVSGKCTVNFGGTATLGVPRTLKQIGAHPVTCYLFGAGKGDPRVLFNKMTNVEDVVVNITGGTIYGSVFGGGEDGHVLRDVTMTIENTTETVPAAVEGEDSTTKTITPTIGTWGTSYVDGNVFGGGRGFTGDAYTAGNVAGSVKMEIKGGSILGSVYGGGRLGSVGYGLFESTNTTDYGVMQPDNKDDKGETTTYYTTDGPNKLGRGHIDITISGGTIGNGREYIIPKTGSGGNTPSSITETDFTKWSDEDWTTWKNHNNIPKTEFDTTTGRVSHTKGGNVFAGGMGNFYKQDSKTPISDVNWWQLGCVKTTKLTISGGTIKSTVFGGGELGQVVGYHTAKNAANSDVNVGTEVIINGGTIGSEIQESGNYIRFIYGSVFGGGYGSLMETLGSSNPKYIAGRVKAGTRVEMTAGEVHASVYGGGKMAAVGESKTLGESLTTGHTGDTHVIISGGTIGKAPIELSDGSLRYFGGAKVGNVYGGGSGHNNTVRSGHIYGNTNVTISDGTIYHNVYGGGAYGSVGDFTYDVGLDSQTGTNKVTGISDLHEDHTNTGVATVTITGGTIGTDGKENGMVFGSSRGDINEPGKRDDHTAWVYDANVTIGIAGTPASGSVEGEDYVAAVPASGPEINGSVYGSGENGHTFHNTVVTVNGGTIGIATGEAVGGLSGAAYPYRGNVYGGGCGTDKYYSDPDDIQEGHTANDGGGDSYNPLAGIVYGTTTVNINGGTVVRNVYGAGAMGSVGKTTWTKTTTTTTTTEGQEVTTTTKTAATTSGGSTTVNINGGTIGTSGTVGDGNVFGAARGAKDIVQADQDDLSRVSVTNVIVSDGEIKGNVYGGGELGDVGTIVKNTSDYNYTWMKSGGNGANAPFNNTITENNTNTGICNVTITGGTIGSTTAGGNVFGGGKGDANTWWCEKAMAFATNVSISEASGSTTVVNGTVYGGGEIGRVEDDSKVIIGTADESDTPEIKGNVFGAGKGMATRGYSALVRGNSIVTVQGSAKVGGSVFGGGEEASLGRYNLDKGLPKSPLSGGYSAVTIQDHAAIGSDGTNNLTHHVYGAGQGVTPNYVTDTTDPNKYKDYKSMQLEGYKPSGSEGDTWDYYINDDNKKDTRFVWVYYKSEPAYQAFLNTLALASHPTVTIAENATVYGDVYGGGQRGITLGDVAVNITGGTVKRDVYGGGSLADTNKGNWDDDRYVAASVTAGGSVADLYTITGSDKDGNPIYTPTASDATANGSTTYYRKGTWAADKYNTSTYVTTFKTNVTLSGGEIGRNVYGGGLGQLAKDAVAAQPAVSAVEAKVYGDVLVTLNGPEETTQTTGEGDNATTTTTTYGDCVVKGTIFGCNNLNGSPQNDVTVHVYKTQGWTEGTGDNVVSHDVSAGKNSENPTKGTGIYELEAVYGGGNLAAFYPVDVTSRETVKANVIIDGCDRTSIGSVYGGGNAASVPATEVLVNSVYEIGEVFGGGNGKDPVSYDGGTTTVVNPGANVGYLNYSEWNEQDKVVNASNATTKEDRLANYAYGIGKTHAIIYGGTVHAVYGGSNQRGNVRVEARTTLEDALACTFNVGEAYGGGNNAPMDGDAVLEIGCISGMEKAYGGAANADVNGDVVLNITNGTYGRVFGGNDLGGVIRGTITVNIEEIGCRPIIIGQLYGGGNLAAYSVENISKSRSDLNFSNPAAENYYKNYPKVNVKSFTSIGTIFGGGYGNPATLEGNPQVNINVYQGKYCNTFNGTDNIIGDNAIVVGTAVKSEGEGYPIPSHAKGAIGAINSVFGGGNEAMVIGNPTVNIGTEAGDEVYVAVEVETGESAAGYYTRSEYSAATGTAVEGTTYYEKDVETGEYTEKTVTVGTSVAGLYIHEESYTTATGNAVAGTTYYLKTVKAVDIRGDVFGGGNNAEVQGDTNVVIGKESTTTP